MTAPIKVGVVGCGYWGPNLIRNLRAVPGCQLVAVCDPDAERIRHVQSLYPEVQAVPNHEELLRLRQLDAVVIAAPPRWHHPIAKASLLAGKHTFVEKPMALSSAQGEELTELADLKGRVLMAGYTFLYSPAVRRIKEIVAAGDLGDIRYISARRLNLGLFQKDINVTWDLAPHDISIILHIMEETPISVNCRGSAHVTPGVEDVSSLCLTFRRERSAIVHSSWVDPRKVREMTIVGSRRMIVYDDVAQFEKIRVFDARVERPPHYDTFAEFHYAYHYGDVYVPYVKQEEPLKVECQHFVDCIRTGTRPLSDGGQAQSVLRILEAGSASLAQQGAPVTLEDPPHGAALRKGPRGNGAGIPLPVSQRHGGRGNGNGRPATRHRMPVLAAA